MAVKPGTCQRAQFVLNHTSPSPCQKKNFPILYVTWRFITVFTAASQLPYPQSDAVHTFQYYLCKIHFNITLPSMPRSSKWYLSLKFPHQNPVSTSHIPRAWHISLPSQPSWVDHPDNTGSLKKMDGIVYLDLFEQYVSPQIENFEQEIVNRVNFMQDGAPPHFSCFVTDVLNERFPDVWIGRGGTIPWPLRSPDLSPLDFFLWGYIKNIVYAEKIRNIQHQQDRITSAIETVTRDMIQKTWQEIEFRLDVSTATNVAHIEMY